MKHKNSRNHNYKMVLVKSNKVSMTRFSQLCNKRNHIITGRSANKWCIIFASGYVFCLACLFLKKKMTGWSNTRAVSKTNIFQISIYLCTQYTVKNPKWLCNYMLCTKYLPVRHNVVLILKLLISLMKSSILASKSQFQVLYFHTSCCLFTPTTTFSVVSSLLAIAGVMILHPYSFLTTSVSRSSIEDVWVIRKMECSDTVT